VLPSSKSEFAARVLARYSAKTPVSDFARELFRSENAASINERFAKAKRSVSAWWPTAG
jgi:predicted transcriptional regulator